MTAHAPSTPTTAPTRAAKTPSTSAWASTVRRNWAVVAPLLAARARVRRCRAALTAKAGPTRRVVSSSSPMAMIAEVIACPAAALSAIDWTPSGSANSSRDGGLRRTWRLVTCSP